MKFFLLPFSLIYGLIAWIRNVCYDLKILKSYQSKLKTIVIGNLQVGGSGKTPMTAYLYWMLSSKYNTAILSRGYGRKTKGLICADAQSNAESIGDEPLWYFQTLPGAQVVVAESRENGLKYLEKTDAELVLLDDAFQHRAVKCGVQILLSDYKKPYYNDFTMPYGRLRECSSGAKRADIIIISKCPEKLSLEQKENFLKSIKAHAKQDVFFSTLQIGNPRKVKGNLSIDKRPFKKIIALSGIANPDSFKEICMRISHNCTSISYKDHHHYTANDMKQILSKLDDDTIVFTTEKDAVKLSAEGIYDLIPMNQFYVLPVQVQFLFDDESRFDALIKDKLLS
jgi:tetraacyldisaccharide 4'-kinase